MTSKEAIQVLKNHNNRKYELVNKRRYAVSVIEQDLEVLDQLKEILSMDYLVRVYGYEMAKRLQTYLKSNNAVKNWLEKRDK